MDILTASHDVVLSWGITIIAGPFLAAMLVEWLGGKRDSGEAFIYAWGLTSLSLVLYAFLRLLRWVL